MIGRTICIWFCVLTLLLVPVLSEAQSLDSSLQNMFASWGTGVTTPPGSYQSQSKGYFSGGGVSVRTFQNSFNVFSVAPPRLSVGCQGIDVYLGAFSYGKLSRYVNLLTQIGTSAVLGYAFQLAMKAICPDCADVLNKIEAAARALNVAGRIQPCQTGNEIAKALSGDESAQNRLASRYGDAWQKMKEAGASIGDVFEDRDTTATQTTQQATTAMKGTTYDVTGNLVWDVLGLAGADDMTRRLIMSATGTVIVDDTGDVQTREPTLTFEQLVDTDTGDTVRVFDCGGTPECLTPIVVGDTTVQGFHNRVYDALTTIVTAIQVGTALAAADITLINMSPAPMYRMISEYGRDPQMADQIVRLSAEMIAADMAYQWMRWAGQEVSRNVDGMKKQKPEFPGDIAKFKTELRARLQLASTDLAKRAGMLNNLNQLMQLVKTEGQLKSRK
jgi:conjugative transfer pilus assembly protein TraH